MGAQETPNATGSSDPAFPDLPGEIAVTSEPSAGTLTPEADEGLESSDYADMSDLDGPDIGNEIEERDSSSVLDKSLLDSDLEAAPAGRRTPRRVRIVGLFAQVLGVLGVVLAVVAAFLSLRLVFGVGSAVEGQVGPLEDRVAAIDDRIDEADDVMSADGMDAEQLAELRTRAQGLVDLSAASDDLFSAVDGHPLYGNLPADLDPLRNGLEDVSSTAVDLMASLPPDGPDQTLEGESARAIAGQLNGLQDNMASLADRVDRLRASLERWVRLAGLIGFALSLWMLWANVSLARRGYRGLRGRPV